MQITWWPVTATTHSTRQCSTFSPVMQCRAGTTQGAMDQSRLHEAFDLRRHVRRARQTGRGARNGLPAVAQVAKALPRNALITFKTRSIVFMTSSQVI